MRYKEIFENTGDDYFNMDNHSTVHNPKSRETLTYMSPDEFLSLANPGFDEDKMAKVRKLGRAKIKFNQIPQLLFVHDNKGSAKIIGHEGRHRALFLKQEGIDKMPVLLLSVEGEGKGIRWGVSHEKGYDFIPIMPQTLTSENGTKTLPMPKSVIFPRD